MPPRLPVVDLATATPEQKAALLEWQTDRNAPNPPGGFFGCLVNSAEGMRRLSKLGAFARFGTNLPEIPREAAVYLTNNHASDTLEIAIHGQTLTRLGVEPATIAAIGQGLTADLPDGVRQAVEFAREMLTTGRVSQPVFEAAQQVFGDQGTVELALVISYYDLIGRLRLIFTPEDEAVAPGAAAAGARA